MLRGHQGRFGIRRLALLCACAFPLAAGAEPLDFESQDPMRWIETRRAAGGFELKSFSPAEPVQLPLRNPDRTVWSAESFPDAAAAGEVMSAVDGYLALDPSAPPAAFAPAFRRIADAALAWARPVVGPRPLPTEPGAQVRALKAVQDRLLARSFAPPFHEFQAKRMSGAGSVSDFIACGDGRWTLSSPGRGNVISVVFKEGLSQPDKERVRAHEWTHVVDYSRLGLVDDGGTQIRALTVRDALFSESKAHAVSFLLRDKGNSGFAEFLRDTLRWYYWVQGADGFRFQTGELAYPRPEDFIGGPPRYLRTIVATHPPAQPKP